MTTVAVSFYTQRLQGGMNMERTTQAMEWKKRMDAANTNVEAMYQAMMHRQEKANASYESAK
jgi:hypothetical protein